jgi:hypothetical protein
MAFFLVAIAAPYRIVDHPWGLRRNVLSCWIFSATTNLLVPGSIGNLMLSPKCQTAPVNGIWGRRITLVSSRLRRSRFIGVSRF